MLYPLRQPHMDLTLSFEFQKSLRLDTIWPVVSIQPERVVCGAPWEMSTFPLCWCDWTLSWLQTNYFLCPLFLKAKWTIPIIHLPLLSFISNFGRNTSKQFHHFGLKIPKIQESQENQVSCDYIIESQAQMEGIEWYSWFSWLFQCPFALFSPKIDFFFNISMSGGDVLRRGRSRGGGLNKFNSQNMNPHELKKAKFPQQKHKNIPAHPMTMPLRGW